MTYLCLIPKSQGCEKVEDFRPISLCNITYKLIAKCIEERLKVYLLELISSNQSAFTQGRKISESVLLAQELQEGFSSKKGSAKVCFQLDISKAFDSINTNYILTMLKKMGFKQKFVSLIQTCIEHPSFAVLVNGKATRSFSSLRGLRQGDPLSLMLLVIAIEGLSTRVC